MQWDNFSGFWDKRLQVLKLKEQNCVRPWLAEAVNDIFNAQQPPYPTTDKLWRKSKKKSGDAPCHAELMEAQAAVWLHNTCHFQSAAAAAGQAAADTPGIEAPMIDITLNDYLSIRYGQVVQLISATS